MRGNRDEVAESEGLTVLGGTALVKHFSRLLPLPSSHSFFFLAPHKFQTPTGAFQPHAEAFAVPPAMLVPPCSQAPHGLSKPGLLDFDLVFFLLSSDALKSGGNSHLSDVLLAKTHSTSRAQLLRGGFLPLIFSPPLLEDREMQIWQFQSSLASFPS